jgi:hypothetical protein
MATGSAERLYNLGFFGFFFQILNIFSSSTLRHLFYLIRREPQLQLLTPCYTHFSPAF